jgi:hypothetical protein
MLRKILTIAFVAAMLFSFGCKKTSTTTTTKKTVTTKTTAVEKTVPVEANTK